MKYSKSTRRVKTYQRYLLAFGMTCAMMLIFSVVQYTLMHNSLKAAYTEVYKEQLSKFRIEMDNVYYSLQLMLHELSQSEVASICNESDADAYDYHLLREHIATKCAQNDYIDDILFYIRDEKRIVSRDGTFLPQKFFADGDKVFEAFDLGNQPERAFFRINKINGQESAALPGVGNTILHISRRDIFRNCRVFCVINEEKITNLFGNNFAILDSGKFIYGPSFVLEYFSTNDVPYDFSDMMDVGKQKYLCKEMESDISSLKYIAFIPKQEISIRLRDFMISFLLLLLLFMSVQFAYSYSVSNSLYRPIGNLTELIRNNADNTLNDENIELEDFYTMVTAMNENYRTTLDKYNRIFNDYREFYIKERLTGNFNKAIMLRGDTIEAVVADKDYFLISLRLTPKNNSHMSDKNLLLYLEEAASLIKDFLINEYNEKLTIEAKVIISSNEYVVVVAVLDCFDAEDKLRDNIQALFSNEFSDNVYASIVIGNRYKGEDSLSNAYTSCVYAYDYFSLCEESRVLLQTDSFTENTECLDFAKEQLMSDIAAKKSDRIEADFLQLICDGEHGGVTVKAIRQCFMEMHKSCSDTFELYKSEFLNETIKLGQEIIQAGSMRDFMVLCEKIGKIMGRLIMQNDKSGSAIVVEKITEYINEHFGEDLYLDFFAKKYDLSPIYLSRIFKQYTGSNFSAYIKDVRLAAAKEFIEREGVDCSVSKLAERVGYRSTNNFINTFKAYYGCTPGAYRDMVVKNDK